MSKLHTLLLSGSLALGTMIAHAGVANADVRNIVLVHGANVDGTTWRDVYDRLTAQDYTVTVAQLPLTSVQDDIAAVQRNLDALDGPVVLVGHSYGGVVISEVGSGPAAMIGLRPGDVITHLNNQAIDSVKTFGQVVEKLPHNRSVSMRVLRQGRASFITFRLPR